jgi:phosphatidylinositol alpha-1,6-mannosyltransferase
LLLTPDFPPARGGIQVFAQRLAENLTGFSVRVVTLDSPGAREQDATSGLWTRRVSVGTRLGAGGHLGSARHVPLNAVALLEALRSRPQVTLSMHIVTSPSAATIRRALGARTVQYFHANEIPDKPTLTRFAARRADRSIAVSSYTAQLLEASGVAPASVKIIPPGVNLPSDSRVQPPATHPTILTVARLRDRYKGHDVLIRVLAAVRARVPDVEWVVIGDGPLRPELERLARDEGVGDVVRFLGQVSDEQRDEWLRQADLFAMPSRLPGGELAGEGFGIVYLEAGAYGKPVIAGNVAGARDAVIDGETGLLVDPTDERAVADAIVRLLLDRELARQLGEGGSRLARELTWPRIAQRVEAVLFEALGYASRGAAA